jgi:hypothetical protein
VLGGVEGIQELRHHDEINSNLYRVLGSFIRWQTSGDVSWKAEGQNTRHCGHNDVLALALSAIFYFYKVLRSVIASFQILA